MIERIYEAFLKFPSVCTDTRNIIPNSIFFALKGPSFNANELAEQALEKGAAYVVIDDEKYKKGERYFLVNDVLTTLQDLANHHRKQLDIPIIAITGSNGKTTSKELLYSVLSQQYMVLATEGNLNNHIGVPLTLLKITAEHEIAIIEMGANHQREIDFLCRIALPTYGLITNIGKAHLEGFGGAEGVIKGKKELYDYIDETDGMLFLNKDDALLSELSIHYERTTYGTTDNVDFIGSFEGCNPFLQLKYMPNEDEEQELEEMPMVTTQLIGNYNFENALAAACIGNYFNVSLAQIKAGLEAYTPSNNRSQVVKTQNNTVLLDAYNANPSSMKVAINNLADMTAENKTVILGDMLELGDESLGEHKAVLELLKSRHISHVILVGKYFQEAAQGSLFTTFATSNDAIDFLKENPFRDATILVKGSRGIKLETVVNSL
jgi:UDP-N-acetylmuramoyl-tripeptide--D-alanyl-D-alanine ligase